MLTHSQRLRRAKAKRVAKQAAQDNALAAAKAHGEQVKRLNETLTGRNNELTQANEAIGAALANMGKELARTNEMLEARNRDIATFKTEAHDLHMQIAELRGYIGRTLEDDAVREVRLKPVAIQDKTTVETYKPRQDDAPRRAGPGCLHPITIMGVDMASSVERAWDSDAWDTLHHGGRGGGKTFRNASIQSLPRAWINR